MTTEIQGDDAYRSEDESATPSRVSVAKKKRKTSVASTAASTSSTAKQKIANKKKAMDRADKVMSNLTGLSPSTHSKGKNKKHVPKKLERTRSKSFLEEHLENEDLISCLTEASKSTRGGKSVKSTKSSKSTRSKKQKKRSPSKKIKRTDAVDETYDSDGDQDSQSKRSEGTRRTKSSSSKKKNKHFSSPNSKLDDEVSSLSEVTNSKKDKKIVSPKDFSKLDKRDKLYHGTNKRLSVHSTTGSVTSTYYSRDDVGTENKDNGRRTRSLSRHSRTSTASSNSNNKKKTNKFGKDGSVRLKILPDGSIKASVPKRSRSFNSNDILGGNSNNEDSDSESVILSDSSDEERPGIRRHNSLESMKKMALVTRRVTNIRSPPAKDRSEGNHASSSSATKSRRNPPPVRIASRGNSVEVRSISADHIRDMQRSLVRNSSHDSIQNTKNTGNANNTNNRNSRFYASHSARGPPLRRGVNRNASAPLRSAMKSPPNEFNRRGSSRGPPQRGNLRKTASFSQQTQRRPPSRTNSKDMSTAEHVEMLKGLTRNNSNNGQRRRSLSQPRRLSKTTPTHRSLSPSRGILRNKSHRADRSDSNEESSNLDSPVVDSGDLDNGDLDDDEGSVALHFFGGDDGDSEHESLNDSKHIMGMTEPRTRELSRARSRRPGIKRSSSNGSMMGFSTHSFMSNRSQMSIDSKEGFDDDPKWKATLRYVHLLPPHKEETKHTKKIRIFTWLSMLLDFIAALVGLVQYSGSTLCCGEPIFNVLANINWDVLFRVVTVLYICMIFCEIVPVIKNGIPFNIVNPTIGLIITFGMFFDDSIAEAVAMWVIEALAIFFEFMVYRVNARQYFETSFKLSQVDEELEALKLKRKEFIEMGRPLNEGSIHSGSMHGSRHGNLIKGSRHGSKHESKHGSRHYPRDNSRDKGDLEVGFSYNDDDDEDSLSGHSFGGDDFYDEKTPSGRSIQANSVAKDAPPPPGNLPIRQGSRLSEQSRRPSHLSRANSRDTLGASSTHSRGASTSVTGIIGMTGGRIRLPGEVKQNRLLRQRRILRENKKSESVDLHYHFIGTVLNVSLAAIAMIFIVTIASTVSTSNLPLFPSAD